MQIIIILIITVEKQNAGLFGLLSSRAILCFCHYDLVDVVLVNLVKAGIKPKLSSVWLGKTTVLALPSAKAFTASVFWKMK